MSKSSSYKSSKIDNKINNNNIEIIESQEYLVPNSIINIDMVLSSGFDIEKIKQFNTKSVDLIFEEKIEDSIEILKKIRNIFRSKCYRSQNKFR